MNDLAAGADYKLLVEWGVVIGASLTGAFTDLRARRIPNRLTVPLVAAGLTWWAFTGGWRGVAESFAAMLVVAAPFVLLFLFGGGGAGDAKLMAGLGAWLGLWNGTVLLVSVVVMGALVGLAWALCRRQFRAVCERIYRTGCFLYCGVTLRRQLPTLPAPGKDLLQMPYGVAICSGSCLAALGMLVWRL